MKADWAKVRTTFSAEEARAIEATLDETQQVLKELVRLEDEGRALLDKRREENTIALDQLMSRSRARGAYGAVAGAGVTYRDDPARPRLEIAYEIARHSYTTTDQWDRISHHLEASYETRLTKSLRLQNAAAVSLKTLTTCCERASSPTYCFRAPRW